MALNRYLELVTTDPTIEFEIRCSGCILDNVINAMEVGDDPRLWHESHDATYRLDKMVVRSSATFDTSEMRISTAHVFKKRLAVEFVSKNERITLSVEQPVQPPIITDVEYFRIKQRRSVLLPEVEFEFHLFRVDFTKAWSGASFTETERCQATQLPTYELEVELVNSGVMALLARVNDVDRVRDYLSARITDVLRAISEA
jgi:hypothetical protein